MPATYTLINSNVLTSAAASVTFSAIPATYTDLVLKWSARESAASTERDLTVRFNNDSSTLYSNRWIGGDGSSASSSNVSTFANFFLGSYTPGANATSNTFSNGELYLPSYTVSQNKPVSFFNALETNSATAWLRADAGLYRSTTAISRIDFIAVSNFVSGSSFYLYGISNA